MGTMAVPALADTVTVEKLGARSFNPTQLHNAAVSD